MQCNNLTYVSLPDSLKTIGKSAFLSTGISDIKLGKNMTDIEDSAFYNCRYLASVYLSEGLTSIGNEVFGGCTNLREINLPSTLKEMGKSVFYGCKSLKSVVIPDGISVIKEDTFRSCESLSSIVIPESVTVIENAFYACNQKINVYYKGTEEEWNAIEIGKNKPLGNFFYQLLILIITSV